MNKIVYKDEVFHYAERKREKECYERFDGRQPDEADFRVCRSNVIRIFVSAVL